MKTTIEIEIGKIKVTTDAKNMGYYDYDWTANVNGKKKKGHISSSYSGQTSNAIRATLKRGYAVQLAIIDLFGF